MKSILANRLGRRSGTFRSAALAAALAFPLAAMTGAAPAWSQEQASITMEGQGNVTVSPDVGVISASVVTAAKTTEKALGDNNDLIAKVIAAMKQQGVEARDIRTNGFNIFPRYEQSDRNSNTQPAIAGYEVRNGIEVKVRDLAKLGDLLTIAVKAGANSVDGIRFEVSNPEEKLDEARKKAVEAARHKAEIFAEAAGVTLGSIVSITETGVQMPQPVMLRMQTKALEASVPVEAGEETISANVTIRWSLD